MSNKIESKVLSYKMLYKQKVHQSKQLKSKKHGDFHVPFLFFKQSYSFYYGFKKKITFYRVKIVKIKLKYTETNII